MHDYLSYKIQKFLLDIKVKDNPNRQVLLEEMQNLISKKEEDKFRKKIDELTNIYKESLPIIEKRILEGK